MRRGPVPDGRGSVWVQAIEVDKSAYCGQLCRENITNFAARERRSTLLQESTESAAVSTGAQNVLR